MSEWKLCSSKSMMPLSSLAWSSVAARNKLPNTGTLQGMYNYAETFSVIDIIYNALALLHCRGKTIKTLKEMNHMIYSCHSDDVYIVCGANHEVIKVWDFHPHHS